MLHAADRDPLKPVAASALSVCFWGVRGSMAVADDRFRAFGGNTMCLEVRHGEHALIIDAGSGLRRLGQTLIADGRRHFDILFTHFHLDHIMGLMSFWPLFDRQSSVSLHVPRLRPGQSETGVWALFDRPVYPMSLKECGAAVRLVAFDPGEILTIGGFSLQTCRLRHPGGACGYRVTAGTNSLSIVTDHEHGDVSIDNAVTELCVNADAILYDAQWDAEEDYERHRGWGHSTWQAGAALRAQSGARCLIGMHHAPDADDEILFRRERALQSVHRESLFAREGSILQLTGA